VTDIKVIVDKNSGDSWKCCTRSGNGPERSVNFLSELLALEQRSACVVGDGKGKFIPVL